MRELNFMPKIEGKEGEVTAGAKNTKDQVKTSAEKQEQAKPKKDETAPADLKQKEKPDSTKKPVITEPLVRRIKDDKGR
jgi:hypothetical protein